MNFPIELDSTSSLPLYKQVANALKESIDSGRLQAGNAVPSTRQLSVHLGVSRITVVQSYEQLVSQGYLRVVTGTGTFVSKSCQPRSLEPRTKDNDDTDSHYPRNYANQPKQSSAKALSEYGSRLIKIENQSQSSSQQETIFGLPPTSLIPVRQWQKLLVKHCQKVYQLPPSAHEALGCRPLREALAGYLRRSRNLNCSADTIAVFANAQQAVNLIAHLLVSPGDYVAVENPGFTFARKTMCSIGAQPLPINVDADGLLVHELSTSSTKCRVVYVTPARQDPLGGTMSAERRQELLAWAAEKNTYIIEDDYDCEYNYSKPPVRALQSLDLNQSVVYVSSFWKVLYPIMPIGFIVAPPHLIPAISQAKRLTEHTFSLPEQLALTDLINEGHLEKHISKTQKQLAQWRQELIFALTSAFGKQIVIPKYSAGMHIAVQLHLSISDEKIIEAAKLVGLSLISTKSFYMADAKKGEFLISFANHQNQGLAKLVAKFAALTNNQ